MLAGDVVVVRTRLLRVGRSSLTYLHEMSDGETSELVARAEIVAVHIDRDTRRSTPFPDSLARHLREIAGGATSSWR